MKLDKRWIKDGEKNGWVMPKAVWWKRLPIIRRIRASFLFLRVSRHNGMWARATGAIPSGYDSWVLYGIAMGQERTTGG